ncbi:bifunctional lytic transglycosylase/C40 family peptidase [Kitasatospora arboriphila]|uniref:NlpC/P60 family protein n=1 Tax=Kitasatospora arboriphila TaxID=258052 RepID=A0ABP4DZV5_9ACTN
MASAGTRIAVSAGVGCLAFLTLAVGAATGVVTALTGGTSAGAAPSDSALADIPPTMLALYQQAAPTCPGLPWTVLAAIGKVETDHGRAPSLVSTAGAVGPMQFLPATFQQYALPVPHGGAEPPTPWDPADAVHAAARLLCAHGARGGHDLQAAVYAYNHAQWYVDKVLAQAAAYAGTTGPGRPAPAPSQAAATAIAFARARIGTPYEWGGTGTPGHGYDCSGLTQAAYAAARIPIPRVAQDQYNAGPRLPAGTPLLPGDLLFYGSSPAAITHTALYTDNGRIIEAPRTGIPVREAPYRRQDLHFVGATRPTARR